MKLVIVESPAKAKTIKKYLGKDYEVIASKGHIVDLPKSEIGIDFEHNYKPTYVVKNAKSLKEIKKDFKNASSLILAMDQDREGEAIAWHIARELKLINDEGKKSKKKVEFYRIVFTEITKEAIQKAAQNPREIDMDLVNAQQARRVLDRIVGYKLSPLLWKKLMFGLSAGRVQSVALRLIVDRESEREQFIKDEFWNFFSHLTKESSSKKPIINIKHFDPDKVISQELTTEVSDDYKFSLVKINERPVKLSDEKQVLEIISKVKDAQWVINDIKSNQSERKPSPPFSTSILQQASANKFGYSASKTMKIAQQLYESGLITYMRTDSFNVSAQAISSIRDYISKNYGSEYIPASPKIYLSKSKVAQEAHEAIRPTDISKKGDDLKINTDQKRLYDLIWKRTMASQMANAILENNTIIINLGIYKFELIGQKVIFQGFLAVHSDKVKETFLPKFKIGQELFCNTLEAEQKYTEPPARYSEATLIKDLEANGIGRPSTYAPIITTILSRKYIEKEGKYLLPTYIGKALIKLLVDHFKEIMEIQFTANMEDDLDLVAEGKKDWIKLLDGFYKDFNKALITGDKKINKNDYVVLGKSDEKCPICKKKMIIKLGRFSPFLSCKDFPKCKGIKPLVDKETEQIDTNSEDFKSKYKDSPLTEDGRNYSLKRSRFGYFWAHPDYPKVKDARTLELNEQKILELFGKSPKSSDGKDMILQRGRFGYFWAHPDYPKKKELQKIDNKQINIIKKDLGLIV
jgi:DNA topoisomerase-1